ncbi:Teneurin-3 [Actinoplanes sp. SE50]|uniref:Dyp-type peroxidase n=1 Tax=unclassified Actinoplanes TaxID=2626549 RepID=UPI00023ED4AC|nr:MULTISPECIES: Dyp-type peroxidase [unclassified Actinoplanes]AEV86730.1 putative iron-dependent peroxidase [Actinoplanes sp. SE50/110]ATO85127.1 Teneurin-3 [Actinoplanes sp. SE50]SLM02538.1 putative iron-dependent peroxidase [Actinoplanes sp. SE50/110]
MGEVTRRAVLAWPVAAAAKFRTTGAPRHQPGIVSLPPNATVLAALDLRGAGLDVVTRLFAMLDRGIRALGGQVETTVSVGASLFDARFGLATARPPELVPMPAFRNDLLDPAQCHGDLLLQVGADLPGTAQRALRSLLTPDIRLRWRITGFRAGNGTDAHGRPTSRNLFGFSEGAGNPEGDDRLWVRPVGAGDAWAAGGTYLVVRTIRLALARWNYDPVSRQELIIGRRKSDGAPLGRTPLDAHVRRADPGTAGPPGGGILRRGYSFRRGLDPTGQPDEGHLFICYQNSIERGFAAVQRRLAGEPLERYVLPVGGGYFFVLPAADRLGQPLLDAGRSGADARP